MTTLPADVRPANPARTIRMISENSFDQAHATYVRCKTAENAMCNWATLEEEKAHEDELDAATRATDIAFEAMITVPVADPRQAIQKLLAIDEHFDLGASGLNRQHLKQVVSELRATIGEEADHG